MAHHKKIKICCRSVKRKRHRKSKRANFGDRVSRPEKAKYLYIIGNGYAEGVASENQPDYASDGYRDSDLYVAEYEVERELGGLINDLKSDFQEWASQLPACHWQISAPLTELLETAE